MSQATILIVDDNVLNLELFTELLEGEGYLVRQARSAEDGLILASAELPDLILMDIGLPGMDGHAAVRVLKADPRTRDIPTVALTAYAMAGDEQRAFDSGFDGYVSKPIKTRVLVEVVAQTIEARGKGP